TGRAHHRDHLASIHREVHATEGVDLGVPHPVDLGEAFRFDNRSAHLHRFHHQKPPGPKRIPPPPPRCCCWKGLLVGCGLAVGVAMFRPAITWSPSLTPSPWISVWMPSLTPVRTCITPT